MPTHNIYRHYIIIILQNYVGYISQSRQYSSILYSIAPPTAPGDIDTISVDSTSITITWTPPTNNGGRTDLYYTVAYSNGSFTSTPVNVENTTQYTITGLTPSTQYTVTVTTNNGVSDQDPDVADRTATINVTTSAARGK